MKIILSRTKIRKFATIVVALALVGGYFLHLSGKSLATWYDDNYLYRQKISVTNNGSSQTNYTLQVVVDTATPIAAGKMQSDCDDVRFTDINGALLNHFLETGCNSAKTVFFVTGNTIQATNSIMYMYYGNPSATTISKFISLPAGINYGNGGDGAITVSSNTNINTTSLIGSRSCADGGDAVNYSVTTSIAAAATSVTLSTTPSSGCLAANDEVLIINLQGTSSGNSNVGKYETARISSISSATLTLNHALTNAYDGTTQKIMVQRIPNYTNVTVNSAINFTAAAWNGTKGGVLFFRADGTATITGNIAGTVLGYRGGAFNPAYDGTYKQGESYGGGYGNAGGSANLGGGGGGINGGNGGGYGTAGSLGACCGAGVGGTYGLAGLSTLFLGSGGGAGADDGGGAGGAIIYVNAATLTVTGTVNSSGSNGLAGRSRGGTSGGSVLLRGTTLTLGTSLVTAAGGASGNAGGNYGGASGTGRIHVDYSSVSGTTNPSADTATDPVVGSFASEEKGQQPAAYWKFDEGYGTTPQDSTINNNDGTLGAGTSAPSWTEESRCVSGKCLQFDGSNDKVTVSNSIAGVQSVSMWVRPISTTTALIDLDGSARVTASSGTISATGFTSPTIYVNGIVSSTLAANTWQYVTVTTGTGITASAIKIGNYSTTFFNGFIDEVKLYPYARTAAQIKADYSKGAAAKGGPVLGASDTSALSNGLVGYWKMDETSGDTADSSGNGFTLTNNSAVTYSAAKFGNGGVFTGSNYFSVADNATLSVGNNSFTMGSWVKLTNKSAEQAIIGKYTTAGNQREYLLEYLASADRFRFYVCQTGSSCTTVNADSLGSPTAGTWYFVVGWYDKTAGTINIQVNGGAVDSTSQTQGAFDSTSTFTIGRLGDALIGLSGTVDESRLYNRVLSGSERQQLYNFAPGPVGYWKLDERTGTSANDSSGNTNTGTLGTGNSAPTWTNGKIGGALNFDGSNDYVDAGNGSTVNITKSFTLEAWVKNSPGGSAGDILTKYDNSNSTGYFMVYRGASGAECGAYGSTTAYTLIGPNIADQNWHHIACVYNTSTLVTYIDGVLYTGSNGTVPSSTTSNSKSVTIGYNQTNNGFFNGSIDDARIYNYARTSKQIVEDMNAGHPAPGSPVGSSVAWWKFDEGQGTTANNAGSGGSTLNGTLTSMASPATSTSGWTNSGKFGKALTFDGSNDYVNITHSSSIQLTTNFTISAWVNPTTLSNATVVCKGSTAADPDYLLDLSRGGQANKVSFYNGTAWIDSNASALSSTGTWSFVTVTYDNSFYVFYVNGVNVGSTAGSGSIQTSTNHLQFGIQCDSVNNPFNGSIDEVKIYNGALSADEVKTEYNRSSSLVLGALSDNSSYQINAANQEYCVPGDSTTCTAPVGEWKMDEATGTSANDTSGNGNTGTLGTGNSAPTWTAGKMGAGLNFDGVNDYATLPNTSTLDPGSGTFTVSGWFKLRATLTTTGYIYFDYGTGDVHSIQLGVLNDQKVYGLYRDGSNNTLSVSGAGSLVNNNIWHYVSWVRTTQTTATMYLDGIAIGTATNGSIGTITVSTGSVPSFGARAAYSDAYFNGTIDQIRIYNYARTPAQIAYDYNGGKPVAHYRLDDCTGSTANDSSGNSNNGTLTIGASGSQTSAGNCGSGTSTEAWSNGATGKFNGSLNFDGTDDYVATSNLALFAANNVSYSKVGVGAWVYPTTSAASKTIFQKNNEIRMTTNSSSQPQCEIYAAGSWQTAVASSTALTLSSWTHLVCTYDGANMKLYVNGLQNATGAQTNNILSINTSAINIGRDSASSGYFQGQIDDVRAYAYDLTAKQVKTVYNDSGAVRYGPASGQP